MNLTPKTCTHLCICIFIMYRVSGKVLLRLPTQGTACIEFSLNFNTGRLITYVSILTHPYGKAKISLRASCIIFALLHN